VGKQLAMETGWKKPWEVLGVGGGTQTGSTRERKRDRAYGPGQRDLKASEKKKKTGNPSYANRMKKEKIKNHERACRSH